MEYLAPESGHSQTGERLGLALGSVALVLLLVTSGWLWRLDQVLYDVSWKFAPAHVPDDIVIVAIDETSLTKFGRWPWPRHLHTQMIQRLHEAGAKVIGFDVLFVEPEDAATDNALASAIALSDRTVLPIATQAVHQGGQMFEVFPLPIFAAAAKMLGHVDVELDADGMARSIFLEAGFGHRRNPALALAMAELGTGETLPRRGARAERGYLVADGVVPRLPSVYSICRATGHDSGHIVPNGH